MASLCALAKKGGGERPIAVGSTLRRLIAKATCRTVRDSMVKKLASSQLGFGVQQGAEAAAHFARTFLTNLDRREAMLKIDFTNAFNMLSRDAMQASIREELPELYPFIESLIFASVTTSYCPMKGLNKVTQLVHCCSVPLSCPL